ncbi:hypothetical protein OUZ56_011875 [Daphnia magna]|uniref:Uncharacterized protein n=1 Tax=Daphnia magna TaxID=35525 RepID=A0ABQ9Z1E0_9CRUS|nr:hypothetical protein OUZ56_011875 [Daphnia magna]
MKGVDTTPKFWENKVNGRQMHENLLYPTFKKSTDFRQNGRNYYQKVDVSFHYQMVAKSSKKVEIRNRQCNPIGSYNNKLVQYPPHD